jgi:acetyl-CoA C-acetyltransferase
MVTKASYDSGRVVYIVDGARTPFLKMKGVPGPFSAADLGVYAGRALLSRQLFPKAAIDQVIVGCVAPSEEEANIARIISLRLGLPHGTPAWTVQRNCASGLQSIDTAAQSIAFGQSELVLAGGTEAMSRAPLLFNKKMVLWLAMLNKARTFDKKLMHILKFKPSYLAPVIGLLKGLTDPVLNINMGQTAEEIAFRFNITRQEMDQYAVDSHLKAASFSSEDGYEDIVPLFDEKGTVYSKDDGIRTDSKVEKLAKLRAVFDKHGNITAGNSSQISDGAAMVLLASESAVHKYNLSVLAKFKASAWAALDPSVMGLGPVHAITPLLKDNGLTLNDIGHIEINEAFAAQVIGCARAWEDEKYCKLLGLDKPFGKINMSNLNPNGGAVALGHPVGASGARLVLHCAKSIKRNNHKHAVASLCIGGGQGGSALLEGVEE